MNARAANYTLYLDRAAKVTRVPDTPSKRHLVPPRPKPGERGRLAYSTAELDGLYATAHKLAPVGLCTLKPPPGHRIHS